MDADWYADHLEEVVRGLMQKLEERDAQITALRKQIESLTKEAESG